MMPTPRVANTAAATATVIRRGDDTAAKRLREHGWLVVPPEHLEPGHGTVHYTNTGETVVYDQP